MSTNDGPGVPPEQSPERTSVFRADFLADVEGTEAPPAAEAPAAEAPAAASEPAAEVDPTGAGDCFDATFMAGLCGGMPLAQALARASAAGAKAVEKRGPMEGNTSQAELAAFMDSCALPAPTPIENPYRG